MEYTPFYEFENMCRTCLATENESLQSIFDCVEDFQNKSTYIYELINMTIHQLPRIETSDELPKSICGNCLAKLFACFEFQQCSISADNHLRKLIIPNECVEFLPEIAQSVFDPLQEDENKSIAFLNVKTSIDGEGVEDATSEFIQSDVESEIQEPKVITRNRKSETVKEPEYVVCDICKKDFSNNKYLRRHVKRMHASECLQETVDEVESESKPDKLFKCDECESEFSKKVYLRKHKYRHKRPGGMKISKKCDFCDLVFHTVPSLKSHRLDVHKHLLIESNIAKKPYVCEYCNKGFQQSCTLKDHIRIHTNEAPYLCSDCGKAFRSNSNLKQHILRHTGERRYECPDCPKKFPCLSDLCSHKQVHKKLRPHVCDTCGAAFGKYSQLKKHNMYHSGEKPFQCEYCEMRFVCADHMRRHMRTHTGEKPYSCKYCTRSFTQSNDMIKHLRSHLGVNVYQCELCPLAFRLATELREHFAQHKNDDDETRDRNKRELIEAQAKLRHKLEQDNVVSGGE